MNFSKRFSNKPNYDMSPRPQESLAFYEQKYSLYLTVTITGLALFFIGPLYFYLDQNYEIFTKLAYDVDPQMVKQLHREFGFLKYLLMAVILGIGGFSFFISHRMIKNFILPILALEKHMKHLIKGKWDADEISIYKFDEHKQLLRTYEYLHKILKTNLEQEVKILEQIKIPAENRESQAALKSLLCSKLEKLGKLPSPSYSSEETDESEQQRRAS